MRTILFVCVALTGCATAPSPAPVSSTNNPINRITVNCAYAVQMSHDLEKIVKSPNADYSQWRYAFSGLSGYSTHKQRTSSAKTLLWSIRTNCSGF